MTHKQWVQQWNAAAPRLREVWEQELQSPDYEKRLETFGTMLNWACANAPPRTTSGLVEQQFYFRKMSRSQNND